MPPVEAAARTPAAFLDRDGTLVVERRYLADPESVELVPGAAEALGDLARAGFALVIVTNQSGIARGLYREEDFRAVQDRIEERYAVQGVRFDALYFCPHHPDVTGPCACRKPALGMYERAAREHGIDLARSLYIGDKLSDVLPALDLGGKGYLVRTGYGVEQAAHAPGEVSVADDLGAAVDLALGRV